MSNTKVHWFSIFYAQKANHGDVQGAGSPFPTGTEVDQVHSHHLIRLTLLPYSPAWQLCCSSFVMQPTFLHILSASSKWMIAANGWVPVVRRRGCVIDNDLGSSRIIGRGDGQSTIKTSVIA
jgi:hypothetical protein